VVLGWGSHVNSFAKLAQVTDAQNKACVKRSRVLFRGTPKIVYIRFKKAHLTVSNAFPDDYFLFFF
jgi:hypothetical protein